MCAPAAEPPAIYVRLVTEVARGDSVANARAVCLWCWFMDTFGGGGKYFVTLRGDYDVEVLRFSKILYSILSRDDGMVTATFRGRKYSVTLGGG